jgi:hypothetical protein
MGRRWTWGGLAALVAVLGALIAPGLAAAANGAITGTIFDPNDAPLPGAHVTAWSGTALRGTATTDASGDYSLALAPGTYAIKAAPSALAQLGAAPAPQWYPGAYARVDAAPVTVSSAATTALADVELPPEGVIAGHLKFPDGSAARASVLVYDAQDRLVGFGHTLGYRNDRYVARGLPPGPLRVLFTSTPAPRRATADRRRTSWPTSTTTTSSRSRRRRP